MSSRQAHETGPARSVDDVLELFREWGDRHYDEELSQTEHALQSAALAREAGAADELVAAALLHDVGHLLHLRATAGRPGPLDDDLDHEAVGARYLAGIFSPAVTGPVALHVRAKRYLAAVEDGYAAALSEGSTASLARQGGPMTADEQAAFAANPGATAALALRRWDDGGKVDGLDVGTLEDHRPLLERLAGVVPRA